ncbi:MAG: four helix bundle protein [Candidatus Gracilibacteria bacterium]
MTTYQNLPVYKTSYDLLILIFLLVKEFSREYKYTLGDSIKKELLELIKNVYKANSSFDNRLINIKNAKENIETLRLYIRLCKDLKIINLKNFVDVSEKIESISKQLFSWGKVFEKR